MTPEDTSSEKCGMACTHAKLTGDEVCARSDNAVLKGETTKQMKKNTYRHLLVPESTCSLA